MAAANRIANQALQQMVHQTEISNHSYTKPDDTLRYLNDCNNYIEGFDILSNKIYKINIDIIYIYVYTIFILM